MDGPDPVPELKDDQVAKVVVEAVIDAEERPFKEPDYITMGKFREVNLFDGTWNVSQLSFTIDVNDSGRWPFHRFALDVYADKGVYQ
jgi:hypothetical protein